MKWLLKNIRKFIRSADRFDEYDISVSRETSDQFYDDAQELFKKHWNESTIDRRIDVAVDLGWYLEQENAGKLNIFAARHFGKLVGYIIFVSMKSPHCTGDTAVCSGVFVEKEYRGMGIFKQLMKQSRLSLAGGDITALRVSCSAGFDIGFMLEPHGFIKSEITYECLI